MSTQTKKESIPEHKSSPKYYSVKEAAEVLGVDEKTVYKAIQNKQLPSRRVGRKLLLPRLAIDPDPATDRGAGRGSPHSPEEK